MKHVNLIEGVPGTTVHLTSTDVEQYIPVAVYRSGDIPAIYLFLQCQEENIRFAYNVVPTGAVGYIFYAGATMTLKNGRTVREFRFISAAAQTPGDLVVTPFFEIGSVNL